MDGRGWFSGCEMFLDDWVSGRCLSVASSRVVIMVLVLLEVDPILGNGIGFKNKTVFAPIQISNFNKSWHIWNYINTY